MSRKERNSEIYVKGYDKRTNKDDLKARFKKFGKISCIQYKGPYSFIEYEDYYDAQAAVKEMHDRTVEGCRLIVEPSGLKNTQYRRHDDKDRRSPKRKESARGKKSERRSRHRSESSSSSSSSSSGSSSSSSISSDSKSSSEKSTYGQRKKMKLIHKDKKGRKK